MNDEYAKTAILESQIEELRKELTQTKIALDIARDGNSQTVGIVLDMIVSALTKQESDLSNYMDQFMTQEERDRHGDSIMGCIVQSQRHKFNYQSHSNSKMEMKRYEPQQKTKIRAIQYASEMHDEIIALYGESDYEDLTPHWWPKDAVIFPFLNFKKQLMIPSCEDCLVDFQVNIGDWIVLQNSDSVSVLSDDVFQKHYKPSK